MPISPILISGQWRPATSATTFRAENPSTGETLPEEYPVSTWADCDEALNAATKAAAELRNASPETIASFFKRFAERIQVRSAEIVDQANLETGLPKSPRLMDVELPRTTNQLRSGADAVLEGSWALPTIDTKANIRSMLGPLGPVCVFGPNNFPFAYNGVCGGDFVSAIAAGNPVIAKAHPSHPGTTRLLAEEALAALVETGMPASTVQMLYHTSVEDGLRLVSDPRNGGFGFTGSRSAGLKLKAAADAAGKPAYLELSSINPVVILPGALRERTEKLAEEFSDSCLMASGQFCTNPGLVILVQDDASEQFIASVRKRFEARPPAPLLSASTARNLAQGVKRLRDAGAEIICGGDAVAGPGYRFANTLLRVSGDDFLGKPEQLQSEAFGNASLIVMAADGAQIKVILDRIEGNLTGSIYSDQAGIDDDLYAEIAPLIRSRVGRLLNDKMPTGVAVSPAMNHGGPYPATGHPGFTAVGIPASLRRFTTLQC
jgi:2,5-dioxopentanoate dehydrogenase